MSVELLQNLDKEHLIQDDVQSSFWVLLYGAVKYFMNNQGEKFNIGAFDYQYWQQRHARDVLKTKNPLRLILLSRTQTALT